MIKIITKKTLETAKALQLQNPCKGGLAKNKDGAVEDPTSPEAVCWCPLGAICKVLDINDDCTQYEVFRAAGIVPSKIYSLNDTGKVNEAWTELSNHVGTTLEILED